MPIGSWSTTTREENHTEAISAVYVPARRVEGRRKSPMMTMIGVSLTNVASDSIKEAATGLSFANARASIHEVRISGVVCPSSSDMLYGSVTHTIKVVGMRYNQGMVFDVQNLYAAAGIRGAHDPLMNVRMYMDWVKLKMLLNTAMNIATPGLCTKGCAKLTVVRSCRICSHSGDPVSEKSLGSTAYASCQFPWPASIPPM